MIKNISPYCVFVFYFLPCTQERETKFVNVKYKILFTNYPYKGFCTLHYTRQKFQSRTNAGSPSKIDRDEYIIPVAAPHKLQINRVCAHQHRKPLMLE